MRILVLLCLLAFTPLAAHADVEDRVERLERTIELLQRKLLAQGADSPMPTAGTANSGGTAYEMRVSTLEEQVRDLRGMIERLEYRQQKQEIELQKMAEDMEYRLQQLEPSAFAPTEATPEAPEALAPIVQGQGYDIGAGADTGRQTAVFEPATQAAAEAASAQANGQFATPREHYDHAFKLLGSGDYEGASKSFTDFIKNFPNTELTGNAYYWLGETYYVRSDYVKAAEQFRLGFEAQPKGPKANDNLLKLAMSLSQIEKVKEACVVLKQLTKKSDSVRESIRRRASAESERIECK